MGAKSSKTVELSNFISNSVVMETYQEFTNSGTQEITAVNKMVFKCPPQQEVFNFILELADKDLPANTKTVIAEKAMEMRENLCTIIDSDITQENMISAEQRIEAINQTDTEIQQKVQAEIDQSQEKINDFMADMVGSITDNIFGANREENTKLLNEFNNELKNTIDQKFLNELHQSVLASNDLFVDSTRFDGVTITQSNMVDAIQELLSQNVLLQRAGQALDAAVTQESREETKGLPSIFSGIAGAVIFAVMALVGLGLILVFVVMIIKMKGGKGGKTAAAPAAAPQPPPVA